MVEATEINNSTFNRMDKVTTSELQRRMATQALVPKKFGKRLVNAFLKVLIDAIEHEEDVYLKGIGTLSKKKGKYVII